MTFPTIFAPLTSTTGAALDACLNFAAALGVIPTVISGTNTIALTLTANAGPISAYQQDMVFSGIIANTNSGAVTANAAGLGALNVYKDTSIGPATLSGAELQAGNFLMLAYDAALNSGAGGFHICNLLVSGGGGSGVSSVNGQTGAVTSQLAGFLSQSVDVYIQPTSGKSCFINPNAAGQIDNMSIGRALPFDGSFSGNLKSVSPTGSPTGGAVLPTLTSLNAQATTGSNTNREFLTNIGLVVNTGQGVANSNGAKTALYVGARAVPGTGGNNPGTTRVAQFVLETDSSTGTYGAQALEIDMTNGNPSAVVTGIAMTLNAVAGGTFDNAMFVSAVSGAAGTCNVGINFAGGPTASPIKASGAAILDSGTTGSTTLQINGTHTQGVYFQSGTYGAGTLFAGGTYNFGISYSGGSFVRGIGMNGGSYTYCIDLNGASVSAAGVRLGNGMALGARNAGDTADQPLILFDPSNNVQIGSGVNQNVLLGTVFSGSVSPQVDNNTQCGVTGLAWGSVTSHAYATVSDPSLKTDIETLPSALALLKKIDPIAYGMRDRPGDGRRWGFDARQVHEVFAAEGMEAGHVKTTAEGDDGVATDMHAYSSNALLAALWRQNQELLARVEALEGRIGLTGVLT